MHQTTGVDVASLRLDLEESVDGEIRFDRVSRALYATDASVYQVVPSGVVVPRTRDALARVVQVAARHGCPITVRGGGTSQAGQAIGSGLVVDTSKYLNRIIETNLAERWVSVEPGVVLDHLNAALKRHAVRFAPDISTASRATIGGMIANNSSGARSVIYGKTIDHVLELEVAFADGSVARLGPLDRGGLEGACRGDSRPAAAYRAVRRLSQEHAAEIDRRFPKVLRRVGGYNLDEFVDERRPFNLSKIIVGSEGTLGVILAAKLSLVPLPNAKAVLVVEFDDLLDALRATPLVLEHRPSAVEVMDRFILDHARESPALDALRRRIMSGDAGALLCVEMYAERAEDLPPRLDALERALGEARYRCRSTRATTPEDQGRIWSFREAALGLSMAMKGDAKSLSFVEDTAVAPEKLGDYIDRFLQIVRRHETVAGVYAHASVGCLHVRPVVNLKTADGVRKFEAIANEIADLVLAFGGALSGEHGDGLVRGAFTEKMFGPVLYGAFRDVKNAFDPAGLLNPGKIVECPPLTANLRYGASYRAVVPATYFDYEEHGDLAGAVEMCSGLGVCRKTLDGTMCPSYMATREEKHSTRGRANTLRLAMAGQLADARLGDDEVYSVLDLCLECRACKAECPVGVDVGRFKAEFLAGYWQRHGTPLRARAIGAVPALSAWGSRLAPLSNLVARNQASRWIGERLFGIDRRRRLPAWSRRTFVDEFPSLDRQPRGSSLGRVVLFVDTFTNHNHPEIGRAAVAVLASAGFEIGIVEHGCCGRPMISQGLLAEARAHAARNVDALHEAASSGEAILFLEPSCLSAVREDAPSLLRGELQRRAQVIADQSMLFEEFLERACADRGARLPMRPGPSTVVLHGHCHQKAMGLLPPARALLSRIPSAIVVDLDAGCCGMAGSFGYAVEHYDVSRAIGERRLLPAARSLQPGAVLVAAGTSCREQVKHFTGVDAVHPAVLLQSLL